MNIENRLNSISKLLRELHGIDIKTINVTNFTTLMNYVIIVTASSNIHIKAITNNSRKVASKILNK